MTPKTRQEARHTSTASDGIALGGAKTSVVGLKLGVSEITIGTVASLEVDKGANKAIWGSSTLGGGLEVIKGEEILSSVGAHGRTVAGALRVAGSALLNERGGDGRSLEAALSQVERVIDSLGGGLGEVVGSGLRRIRVDSDNGRVGSSLESIEVDVLASNKRPSRGEGHEGREVSNGAHRECLSIRRLSKSFGKKR